MQAPQQNNAGNRVASAELAARLLQRMCRFQGWLRRVDHNLQIVCPSGGPADEQTG